MNAAFAPFGRIILLHFPDSLTYDTLHLTAEGAYLVAEAIHRYEQENRPR